jgi:outer membrane protein TolC
MSRQALPAILCLLVCGTPALSAASEDPAGASSPTVLPLKEAVRLALARAPEAALARLAADRAGQAVRETRALNRPVVTIGSGLAYNNGFPLSIEGAAPSLFQAGFTQPILSSKNRNLIREAEENRDGATLGNETARNEVATRVVLLYSELHYARRVAALWRSRVEGASGELQVSESQLEAGRLRPVDVARVRTVAAAARQQLLVVEETAQLSDSELHELTGLPPGSPVVTEEPKLDSDLLALPALAIYERAAEQNPEIRQAESAVRAREFHVEAEKGEFRPRLDLVSQYALLSRANNYQDYFNQFTRNNFIVGLAVQVPLFEGQRSSARVAQSRQEAAEARLRLQRLKTDLKLGVERAASALRSARGAADLAAVETDTARETLRVQETLMEAGRISTRELDESRGALREKEIGQIDANRAVFQRQVDLLRVAGALAECFEK